ncbi:MAG: YrdB family protein [Ornithinibacter sp.]
MSEPRIGTPSLLALAVVALIVELALFGGVGVVAHDALDGGVAGWVAGVPATGLVLVLWGLFMAPKARLRLAQGPRVLAALLLTVGTAYGLVQTGHQRWGWFVGLAGLVVVTAQVVLTSDESQVPIDNSQ